MKIIQIILCLIILVSSTVAEDSLAVINFKVNNLDPSIGEEVADLVSAILSSVGSVQIVERTYIKKLFEEQEIGQQGLTTQETAAQVQKIFGAKFFVHGKLFPVGKKLYLSASLVSSETSLKKTILVKEPISDDYVSLAEQAAMKIVEVYLESGRSMKPTAEVSAISEIKETLKHFNLPSIAIHISEKHISQEIPDPAVQTEFVFILQSLGAEVAEYKETVKSGLLAKGKKDVILPLDNFDVLITGEAFSTFGGRRGNLISCKARVELKAKDVKSGKLLCIGRDSLAGVDVSEPLAAKKSLQLTAEKLARSFIPQMVKTWKEAQSE